MATKAEQKSFINEIAPLIQREGKPGNMPLFPRLSLRLVLNPAGGYQGLPNTITISV